jgi:hypothetical protein
MMHLYAVYLKGSMDRFNPAYVIAKDTKEAYQKVKKYLDGKDYGFTSDRVLKSIELLADVGMYGEADSILFYKKDGEG